MKGAETRNRFRVGGSASAYVVRQCVTRTSADLAQSRNHYVMKGRGEMYSLKEGGHI